MFATTFTILPHICVADLDKNQKHEEATDCDLTRCHLCRAHSISFVCRLEIIKVQIPKVLVLVFSFREIFKCAQIENLAVAAKRS